MIQARRRHDGDIDLSGAVWRKSSRSQPNGACVEVAFPDADWRTSSYTQGNGACVQVALNPAVAGIRDSKDPDGGVLLAAKHARLDLVHKGLFRG